MRRIQIGFLGFGNIGTGVYKILQEHGSEITDTQDCRITVKKILVRDITKKRPIEIDRSILTDNLMIS